MSDGRLVVCDEGGPLVHIDMYRDPEFRYRISVSRRILRLYAEWMLIAANNPGAAHVEVDVGAAPMGTEVGDNPVATEVGAAPMGATDGGS